jgi:hypothetical protein
MNTKVKPAKWLSAEFISFYVIIAYAAFTVLKETFRISNGNQSYQHLLSAGWLLGKRQIVIPPYHGAFLLSS